MRVREVILMPNVGLEDRAALQAWLGRTDGLMVGNPGPTANGFGNGRPRGQYRPGASIGRTAAADDLPIAGASRDASSKEHSWMRFFTRLTA